MTPTQAQIEAGEYDLKCTNGHDRCYMGTSDDCPYCERVALTAAADVGEDGFCEECGATLPSHKRNCKTGSPVDAAIAATIERCAQVARDAFTRGDGLARAYIVGEHIAKLILALKDKP